MRRYFRIYQAIIKLNFALIMAYRANFINNVISSVAWGTFNIIWIGLITNKTTQIFGWGRDELVVMTICYVLITGIFYALFTHNFEEFSRIIDRGEFDSLLLKPLDAQFQICMMRISISSLFRIPIGVGLLIWWMAVHHFSVGIFQAVSFILLLGVGVITMYAVWSLFMTILIWYPNLSNMVDFLYTINSFARYPAEMLKKSGILLLLIFIPLSLTVATSVKALLQKNAWGDTLLLMGLCIILVGLSRMFWKRALRSYTSAS